MGLGYFILYIYFIYEAIKQPEEVNFDKTLYIITHHKEMLCQLFNMWYYSKKCQFENIFVSSYVYNFTSNYHSGLKTCVDLRNWGVKS